MEPKDPIKPGSLTLAFVSATRHDEGKIKSLGRGEFLEILLRIAHLRYRQQFEQKPKIVASLASLMQKKKVENDLKKLEESNK